MGKINISAVPLPQAEVVGPLVFTVEGQGEFRFWLREPDLPAALAAADLAQERTAKWCKPGTNRYPCEDLIQMSGSLWTNVGLLLVMLCGPEGEPLADADRYSEDDLLKLSLKLPEVFVGLVNAASDMQGVAEERQGNASGDLAESSSASPSTTEPATTPT